MPISVLVPDLDPDPSGIDDTECECACKASPCDRYDGTGDPELDSGMSSKWTLEPRLRRSGEEESEEVRMDVRRALGREADEEWRVGEEGGGLVLGLGLRVRLGRMVGAERRPPTSWRKARLPARERVRRGGRGLGLRLGLRLGSVEGGLGIVPET